MSLPDKMMTGDIVLVHGNRFPTSNIIRLITGSPYTHVGIAVDDQTLFEVDAFDRLQRRTMRHEDYVLLRLKKPLTIEQRNHLKHNMRQMEANSKGYDWRMIFALFIQKIFKVPARLDDPHRFICTEVVDELYRSIGITLLTDKEILYPYDVISSELLEIIYDSVAQKNKLKEEI